MKIGVVPGAQVNENVVEQHHEHNSQVKARESVLRFAFFKHCLNRGDFHRHLYIIPALYTYIIRGYRAWRLSEPEDITRINELTLGKVILFPGGRGYKPACRILEECDIVKYRL